LVDLYYKATPSVLYSVTAYTFFCSTWG